MWHLGADDLEWQLACPPDVPRSLVWVVSCQVVVAVGVAFATLVHPPRRRFAQELVGEMRKRCGLICKASCRMR